MIGKTLGHYEITSQLGKGGMGEVYQAKDQNLGRNVAIKVLPEEFAKDTDRIARLQREAKVLASLNHPNIASIYGLEESGKTNFLVLELVEGETLADRIKQGPIPVEEALTLALQITEALEAAHEKGIIHRDLKPANIKVTPDGKVKVLDFGLAKAYAGDQVETNLSASPTLSNLATQQGIILGTAAYMSPEQARGKTVDKRTDIWAFGCVLYEMLTGQATFQGEDVTEILAAVVKSGVNLDSLPAKLHPRVREVIIRCLQKDLRKRYSNITDARYEIEQALADPGGAAAQPLTAAGPPSKLKAMLPWIAALLLLAVITAGIALWKLSAPEARQVMRFDYQLPEDQQMTDTTGPVFNISPDGKQIVYATPQGLYLRSVDELNAKLIAGSDPGAEAPIFSPDGKSIAYFSLNDQKLKRIAVGGGAPVVLCAASTFRGASWHKDGFIIYSADVTNIMRIPSGGGTPQKIAEGKSGTILEPQILPDGKTVLYTVGPTQPRIMVQSPESKEPKELFAGWIVRYLPSGHIIYYDPNDNLCAVQFDANKLESVGEHVPMIPRVDKAAVSDSGTLVYTLESAFENRPQYTLVWVDKAGKEVPLEVQPNQYDAPKISPDGKRIALLIESSGNNDIWIWDIERKNMAKLTLDKTSELQPVWTPDSRQIIYYSTHEYADSGGIYRRAADGSGKVEKLISASDRSLMPFSLSRDGKILLIQELVSFTNADIGMLSLEGKPERKLLLQNEFSEAQPAISPDGRLMAYISSESTGEAMQTEVYIRPLPDVDKGKVQVSTGGGNCPLWSPDGKQLYYLRPDNSVVAVSVKTEPMLSLGAPETLFQSKNLGLIFGSGYPWDIHPDGKRFLMIKPPAGAAGKPVVSGARKIIIVLNWTEELKQRALQK